jgi:ABC-2 type transport system permease protein
LIAMRAALAMEWEKLRPVHKTSRTIALAIGLAVTVSALVALAMASSADHMSTHDRQTFDSLGISLEGVNAAVLAVAAFGILSVTREYATGMMAVTFLAQPARLRVLAAKLLTHAGVAGLAGAGACVAAFAVGQTLLSTGGLAAGWSAPELPAALGGGVVYLVLICIWGIALGALVRTSSAAITTSAFLLVVAPILVQVLPDSVVQQASRWLPSQIGVQAMSAHHDSHAFAPWIGLAVLAGYVGLTLVLGAVRMTRSDP